MNKTTLVLDIDDTIIVGNTWEKFNSVLGISDEIDYSLYQQYVNGKLSYDSWQKELHARYKPNVPANKIRETLTNYELVIGAAESVHAAERLDLAVVLLTGGFQETADAIASELGIKHALAVTSCVFKRTNDGEVFSHFSSKGEEKYAKLDLLHKLCEELHTDIEECITVGDGANDIELFKKSNCGVTFSYAKEPVLQAARYNIQNLTNLPDLLNKLA